MTATTSGGSPPIPRERSGDILRRIEAARTAVSGPAALAFDADGTLWEGDVGFDIFEAFLAARAARAEAEEALRREVEAFGVAVAAESGPHELAAALYAAFQAERYPEDRAFATMAWAFAGFREDEVHAFAEEVLRATRIEDRIRPAVLPFLDWARSCDVEVYVVSASPRAMVHGGARRLGIPPERVLAMTPAVRDGRLAPELGAPATYGEGKIRALEAAIPAATLLAAFGDSAWDAAMLRAARVPVAIAPSPKLLALADTLPGLVELEL